MSIPKDAKPNRSLEDEGLPDLQDASSNEIDTGDGMDQLLPPRRVPQALDEFGTTAAEQAEGESLEKRLRRELPNPGDFSEPTDRTGRLVEPDSQDVTSIDATAESVGSDAGYDSGGFTAEEQAMHIEE